MYRALFSSSPLEPRLQYAINYPHSGSILTAKKLIIHHEQFSSSKNTHSKLKQENNCKYMLTCTSMHYQSPGNGLGTRVTYSRKEILDCNSLLFPMPEFTVSVWLMDIVKPPFHMVYLTACLLSLSDHCQFVK